MFDPARVEDAWTGGARGPGPVGRHVFGLDLPELDRAALVRYLELL